MTCVIHEGGYCPGCLIRYDARFYGDLRESPPYEPGDEPTFEMLIMQEEHEDSCLAYRDRRITQSLKFFARLDAERAMSSW
jgi:hypothetical protein